jgi:predicted nucleic acid-binding protein
LAALTQVPVDGEAARIRSDLEAGGLGIGPIDLMIAGSAVSRGAVLATSKTREFSRVKASAADRLVEVSRADR